MQHRIQDNRYSIFLPNLLPGGAEKIMVKLARCLHNRGLDIDVVLGMAEGPYLDELDSEIRVVNLKQRHMDRCVPGLSRYLRATHPAAMLSALDHANIAALLARRLSKVRTRVIVSVRTTISQRWRYMDSRAKGLALSLLAPRIYRWADVVIAVSRGVASDLAACRVDRRRIRTIPNPVDIEEISGLASKPLEDPFLELSQTPLILSVGRLTPVKDYPTLLRAFATVRALRPVRLMILGEGPERERLQRMAFDLGIEDSVKFLGFVENPYRYMGRSALFVLSSRVEGFPNALLEALACGLPVVATDCPSGPAEILDGGRFGTLVPPGDVPAMADAIMEVLDSKCDRDSLRRRAGMYAIEKVCSQYAAVLRGG